VPSEVRVQTFGFVTTKGQRKIIAVAFVARRDSCGTQAAMRILPPPGVAGLCPA